MVQANNIQLKREFLGYIIHKDFYPVVKNESKNYIQHGQTSTFNHCRDVAFTVFLVAKKRNLEFKHNFDIETLVLAAFFHDFFRYDWHEKSDKHRLHGYTHAHVAAQNAASYGNLSSKGLSIIESHMWPLNLTKIPRCREAWLVCMYDKLVSLNEIFQ